jgi:hypothetical protein
VFIYVLHDRDTKCCEPFRTTLAAGGITAIALPSAQPQFEPMSEAMGVRQTRMSGQMTLFGEGSLRRAPSANSSIIFTRSGIIR